MVENKEIVCKHCNLHFSTEAWLKKHIASNHTAGASSAPKPQNDQKTKILNYKKQLEVIQQTLEKKNTADKSKKKVAKQVSPSKQKLREQLKAQLAAQQKLLQVQQEIFEKTSKAQKDIFELIAKLGDDSDVDEVDEIETEFVKCEDKSAQAIESEIYYDHPDGELIVAEHVEEYAYMPENYELEEQQLITDDGGYVMLNDQNGIGETVPEDQAVMVIVRSGDDEEEYELLDVVEDQLYENNPLEHIDNGSIDFEVVGKDNNSVHCRIIANEEIQEEIEYVDVQVDKVPVKLEVGKIQQIAQKRFNKQLDKIKEESDHDSKLLNDTINKSEKHTNEYIQKVVQNAVPTEDNKFECPICHEMVSNRYSLGPHILRLHSKQKSKICQYCDRSFTCTGDLTRYYH